MKCGKRTNCFRSLRIKEFSSLSLYEESPALVENGEAHATACFRSAEPDFLLNSPLYDKTDKVKDSCFSGSKQAKEGGQDGR